MDPLITCVLPCYNRSKVLARSMQSILQQKLPVEIIIVDDASHDDSITQANQLKQQIEANSQLGVSVKVYCNNTNMGPGPSRNIGAFWATTKYICFLDPGDEYLPNFFRQAIRVLEAKPEYAAYKGNIELANVPTNLNLSDNDPRLATCSFTSSCNQILRRYLVPSLLYYPNREDGFNGELGGEDCAFMLALKENFVIFRSPQPVLRYHLSETAHFVQFIRRTELTEKGYRHKFSLPEEKDGRFRRATIAHAQKITINIANLRQLTGISDVQKNLSYAFGKSI